MIFKEYCNSIQPISDECITWLYEYFKTTSGNFQNSASKFILDFKNKKTYAIEKIAEELIPLLDDNFAIAVFPPSDPRKNFTTPCHILANKIIERCGTSKHIYNASECLYRFKESPTQHLTKTKRTIRTHLDTIISKDFTIIKDKDVLVLDDISTSGESMRAAFEILKKCGAKTVVGLVIGKTMYNIPKYTFILDVDQTLFNTSHIEPYRKENKWNQAFDYAKNCPIDNNIYEFMKKLDSQQGYSYCITTTSPILYTKVLIDKFNLKKAKIFSYKDINHKFPNQPDKTILLLKARNFLNSKNEHLALPIWYGNNIYTIGAISPNNYILVVDNKYENLQAAKNLGMITIGALWFSDPNTTESIKIKNISDMYYTNFTDFYNDMEKYNFFSKYSERY